jgi:arsenate reductase
MAEATFNHLAPTGWRALSAGSKPTGYVHPRALELLTEEGISHANYFSKSWQDLPVTPDIVVSVCANAANEACPNYLTHAIRTHWGVDDPAHAVGSEDDVRLAFREAYMTLRFRIEQFFQLPLQQLIHQPEQLKAAMDAIGLSSPTALVAKGLT